MPPDSSRIEPNGAAKKRAGKLRHAISSLLGIAIFGAAIWVLWNHMRAFSIDEILDAVARQPRARVLGALGLTGISFAALAVYDVIAARIVAPGRTSIALSAFAGAVANAISNTLGFHAFTATAVRLRIYGRAGLTLDDVARIISLSWAALAFGFLTMLALAMLFGPVLDARTSADGIPLRFAGGAIATGLGGVVVWLASGKRRLAVWRFAITLPSAPSAAVQMIIGAIENIAAIGALYILLPPDLAPPFAVFAVAFIGSVLLGVVSHAPGGLGVFEATIIALLAKGARPDLLAALLLFRLIYNILPFVLFSIALAVFEILVRRPSSTADSTGSASPASETAALE